jgi:hypothetical protein
VRFLCAFSRLFQRQNWRPWPASADGDSFAERTDFWRQYSLLLVEKFIGGVVDTGEQNIAGVVDTGEQFIAGIIDTGDKFFPGVVDTSPVSLSPAIKESCLH